MIGRTMETPASFEARIAPWSHPTAKGNLPQQNASRTLCRNDAPSALERVRQAAKRDKEMRFTALLHPIYNPEMLRKAYRELKREAAPGVDGETWQG
jgi:RNA-directed DNA polymerase